MRRARPVAFAAVLAALAFLPAAGCGSVASESAGGGGIEGWMPDWAVAEGFKLTLDTQGYSLPSAIAFVPDPGSGPDDPLYFVTELRGTVKVVTNDRTVHTFAQVRTLEPSQEAPAGAGQAGLAGICLDPKNGYVFVTHSYEGPEHLLRNAVVRFETDTGTFGLKPVGEPVDFADVFAPFQAGPSHQIGGCQVVGDSLFVSVGDGWNASASQDLDQLLGKVLRLTLDGDPHPGNPFADDDDEPRAQDYVWAYGLRNPFGLKAAHDQLFATNNGPDVDSFLRIERGRNYRWDGSDWSVGVDADAVFAPALSPVQLDLAPSEPEVFPAKYRDTFFFAATGAEPFTPEPGTTGAGIVRVPYDFASADVREVPSYFLEYRGAEQQLVVGLAFGRDGLYFVPLLPGSDGSSAVIRISYDPAAPHPYVVGRAVGAAALMQENGCFSCHELNGTGGTAGPSLDQLGLLKRLQYRLNSPAWVASVQALQGEEFEDERREVLEAEGRDRLRLWVKNQILSPGFDNPSSRMPDLGLSEEESERIATYLVGEDQGRINAWLHDIAAPVFGESLSAREGVVAGFVLGIVVLGAAFLVSFVAVRMFRRRRA